MIIELGLPSLDEEEIVHISEIADNQIKKFIFSKVSKSKVTILENIIEINNENNICYVEMELELEIPTFSFSEVEKMANDALTKAYEVIEKEFKK